MPSLAKRRTRDKRVYRERAAERQSKSRCVKLVDRKTVPANAPTEWERALAAVEAFAIAVGGPVAWPE
jgi:hypothetical protein